MIEGPIGQQRATMFVTTVSVQLVPYLLTLYLNAEVIGWFTHVLLLPSQGTCCIEALTTAHFSCDLQQCCVFQM